MSSFSFIKQPESIEESYRPQVPKPILVTGIHRSGSTWVGNVLAQSSSVHYVHEPFNGMCQPGMCAVDFPNVYLHITEANSQDFYPAIRDLFQLRYNLWAQTYSVRGPIDLARLIRDYYVFSSNRRAGRVPLIKDPMAILSAQWLAQKFDANILLLVRHPAAFVSSCLQLGWGFHFNNFLRQPVLMDTYFHPYKAEIVDYARQEHRLIDQLSLLWKLIYSVVAQYQQKHPEWLIVKYEEICQDPLSSFGHITHYLNLDFTSQVQSFLKDSINYIQPKDIFQDIHSIKRDTQKQLDVWKSRLSKTEVHQIRVQVEEISSIFYADSDW